MKTNWQIKKLGEISDISPKQMVSAFISNPPVQAKTIIEKHYIGLWIKVSGKVEDIDLMSNYITFNFHDKDGVYVSANFFKPVSSEVSLLKKGTLIDLVGQVFNIGEHIVVLDHCELTQDKKLEILTSKPIKEKWWEKSWVQIVFFIGAIAGIIGLIVIFI